MDLLERYLHAIRRNLPSAKADDIVAELRDDLSTQIEDREEALGRRLSKNETSAMLKEFGHPLMVASRYRTQQYLIGPDVFPFYVFVVRIVALIVIAVLAATGIAHAVFGDDNAAVAFLQIMSGVWPSLLISLAVVTIVFAVLERAGFPADHLRRWRPEQLPDVRDKQKGVWESAIEVALGVAFLLWWSGVLRVPFASGGPDFRIEPAPIWSQAYWPILILAGARLVENLIQWAWPRWQVPRMLLGIAISIATIGLLGILYRAGHWATVVSTGMPAAKAAELETAVNLGLHIAIAVIGVILTLQCLGELWRLFRLRSRPAV